MSCYHPLTGYSTGVVNPKTGHRSMIVTGRAFDKLVKDDFVDVVPIRCGKCIGCRLDYARQWADRMMLELDHSRCAVFMTLTYNDDHVTQCGYFGEGSPAYTLVKSDVQLFFKRFRARKEFLNRDIRYYLAGEYGSTTLRPHYHAIVFGVDLSDFVDLEVVGTNELGQLYYNSDLLADIWSNGFVSLSAVSWQTCAYVARYVTKKLTGDYASFYDDTGQMPEFSLSSRRPGIAGYYLIDHPEYKDLTMLPINDANGTRTVKQVSMPNYLVESLRLTDPAQYDKLKDDRAKYANDKMLLELMKTDLCVSDYFALKERNFHDRTKALLKYRKE